MYARTCICTSFTFKLTTSLLFQHCVDAAAGEKAEIAHDFFNDKIQFSLECHIFESHLYTFKSSMGFACMYD